MKRQTFAKKKKKIISWIFSISKTIDQSDMIKTTIIIVKNAWALLENSQSYNDVRFFIIFIYYNHKYRTKRLFSEKKICIVNILTN